MRKWAVRIGIAFVALVLLGGVGLYIALRQVGKGGSGLVENWVSSQLQTIANAYLNPHLSFTDLDYQYPGTVHLKNLKLTAADPAHPGQTITILGTDSATIVLAEIPSINKPIVIERITLDKPSLRAVAVAPESNDFVGFSNFIKTTDASTQPSDSGPGPKLSEIFRMRLVELKNATIVYDPRIPGTQTMELDDISTRLDVEPTDDGWYKLATQVNRSPLFDLKAAGQLNIDTFALRKVNIGLGVKLAKENYHYLPPQIQQLLAQYEVRGALTVALSGNVKLDDPLGGTLATKVHLQDVNVGVAGYHVPVKDISLTANLANRKVYVPELAIKQVQLSADDPTNPKEKIVVLGLESATIQLREIASMDDPLYIENLTLDKPLLQAVSLEPGSTNFAGYADLLKALQPPAGVTAKAAVSAAAKRFSDIVQMRLVNVNDAKIVYNPRLPGTAPMELDGINTQLNIQPTRDGWYTLQTALARPPLFNLKVDGQISLDSYDIRGLKISLDGKIDPKNHSFLPPQIQQVLNEHEIRGNLNFTLAGDISANDPLGSGLTSHIELQNANLALGDYQIPIDDLQLNAHLASRHADIDNLTIKALGGQADISAKLALNDEMLMSSKLNITNMVLEDTLRQAAADDPKYRGRVNADVEMEEVSLLALLDHITPPPVATTGVGEQPATEPGAEPLDPPGELAGDFDSELPAYWGGGTLSFDEARLADTVTFLRKISELVGKFKQSSKEPHEKVNLAFDFSRDKIDITSFYYKSDIAVSHGRGTLSLQRMLDMTIDAGGIFGNVGNALVAYRVTGPAANPNFGVKFGSPELTAGTKKVGNAIGTAGKAAGSGLNKVGKGVGGLFNKVFKKK